MIPKRSNHLLCVQLLIRSLLSVICNIHCILSFRGADGGFTNSTYSVVDTAFKEAPNRGIFWLMVMTRLAEAIIHVKQHPLECTTAFCERRGKELISAHTHTSCRTQKLDQPNQGLKWDQKTLQISGDTPSIPRDDSHQVPPQYRVQIYTTKNRKQVTLWRTYQLTTKSENTTGEDLSQF